MIIQRQIRQHSEELARFFPIVSLTGPRQERIISSGRFFENLILAERLKHGHHTGYPPRLYFYRDSNQAELALF